MNKLNDEDFLDFLMTSDFKEIYKSDDYISMLNKFRYFYKLLYNRYNLYKIDNEKILKKLDNELKILKEELFITQVEKTDLQNVVDINLKERKLTWKERFNGKIKRL
jgi:hypothetical protein